MINIIEKKAELDELKSKMKGSEYFSRHSLKLREWDVLASVCALLKEAGEFVPEFALESESPDFNTFTHDKSVWLPIEISEVLHSDYRRGVFWAEHEKPDAPKYFSPHAELTDPWLGLRTSIESKSKKHYPPDTALWIYFDISRHSFPDWSTPFEQQLIMEHARCPFQGISSFSQVLILWPDMSSLTELHPTQRAIITDANAN